MKRRYPVFTRAPWREADGDPANPSTVLGVPVAELLSERPDGGGALVRLADRRYALTGSTVVVGPRRKLERFLRRQRPDTLGEEWLSELRGVLGRRPGTATP